MNRMVEVKTKNEIYEGLEVYYVMYVFRYILYILFQVRICLRYF